MTILRAAVTGVGLWVLSGLAAAPARALPIEPVPPEPSCPITCDDRNPCTDDSCVDGACRHTPNVAPCQDANPCTYNERCSQGRCVAGSTTVCAGGDPCMNSVCDGAGGCTKTPIGAGEACSDGNACTYGEVCDERGACVGGKPIVCKSDPCMDRACNGSEKCLERPRTPGTLCSDGDPCSHGDACDGSGTCVPRGTVTCTSDTCNVRTCNGTAACKVIPRAGTPCDDGEACSFDDVCQGNGVCEGKLIECSSDDTAERTCNGGPTCTVKPRAGTACDDGNACTHGDLRGGDGVCRGMPYTCPVTACLTANTCDGRGGCRPVSKPDETACDADGSLCTPHDVCRAGVCVPDPRPVRCIERDCNAVSCNPDTGNCDYQPSSGGSCGVSGCSEEGTCADGVCSGKPKDCSAFAGPCTDGLCDADTGECVAAPKTNGSDCSPGGACRAGAVCSFGVCELPPATCAAPSAPCRVAACDATNGQCTEVARPPGAPCDPKNSCISDAVCDAQGACLGTPAANGDPCALTSGEIGQCVAGTCVASASGPSKPPSTATPDAGAVDAPGTGMMTPAPMAPQPPAQKGGGGCAFAAAPVGTAGGLGGLLLLGLALLVRRRR